jgi:hypothetical protein
MQNVVRLGKTLALAASVAAAIVVPMAVRAQAGAAVDKASGLICVADTANHRVQVFRAQAAAQ